jgi:hypothetical protein
VEEDGSKAEAPADGAAPPPAPPSEPEAPAAEAAPEPPKEEPPAPEAPKEPDEVGAAAQAASPEPAAEPMEAAAAGAPVPKAAPKPRPKRPPRPREPLPWPELRAAAAMARDGADVEELKELFRLLPNDVRDETVDGVREYRKGARRPVSAYAGKALARAVHTARRARRRPDSDEAVSEAMGQALAAEVIASLEVEIAAEVILPKRDLLERESKNARRRQKAEDDKSRDERRRRAREESGQQGTKDGTYSGAKIRGLDQLAKLFDTDEKT